MVLEYSFRGHSAGGVVARGTSNTRIDFPLGIAVPGGLTSGSATHFYFFLFRHSFSELPRPIALKLCHMVGIWLNFIILLQKLGGSPPKKFEGQKRAKFPSTLDHFGL